MWEYVSLQFLKKLYCIFLSKKNNIITIIIIFKMADDIKGLVAYGCSFFKFQIILQEQSTKDFTFFASSISLDQ